MKIELNIHNDTKIFVVGDLHGNYKGLSQVLLRSNYRKGKDLLISLGDIVDGWGGDLDCFELLKTHKAFMIKGNHDEMFLNKINNDQLERVYPRTLDSFLEVKHFENGQDFKLSFPSVYETLSEQYNYLELIINGKRMLFVHGGFNRHYALNEQPKSNNNIFCWDRDLWLSALGFDKTKCDPKMFRMIENFDKIFIGHSPTLYFTDLPVSLLNGKLNNVDTGGGYEKGKVTLMNVLDTNEYYQSDESGSLYPNLKPIKVV